MDTPPEIGFEPGLLLLEPTRVEASASGVLDPFAGLGFGEDAWLCTAKLVDEGGHIDFVDDDDCLQGVNNVVSHDMVVLEYEHELGEERVDVAAEEVPQS